MTLHLFNLTSQGNFTFFRATKWEYGIVTWWRWCGSQAMAKKIEGSLFSPPFMFIKGWIYKITMEKLACEHKAWCFWVMRFHVWASVLIGGKKGKQKSQGSRWYEVTRCHNNKFAEVGANVKTQHIYDLRPLCVVVAVAEVTAVLWANDNTDL